MCSLGNSLNCRVLVFTCAYDSCFVAKASGSLYGSLCPVCSRLCGLLFALFGRHIRGGFGGCSQAYIYSMPAFHEGHTGEGQPTVSVNSEGSQGRDLSGNQRVGM